MQAREEWDGQLTDRQTDRVETVDGVQPVMGSPTARGSTKWMVHILSIHANIIDRLEAVCNVMQSIGIKEQTSLNF